MADLTAFAGFFVVYAIIILIFWGVSIALYLLQAFGIYAISKKLGLNNPWLGFLPIANVYAIGAIGDRASELNGKPSALRKWLLATCIGLYVLMFILFFLVFILIICAAQDNEVARESALFSDIVIALLGYLLMIAVAIANKVIMFVSLYRIYKLLDPKNATLYIVLSIFFSCSGIILFLLRKNQPQIPINAAPVQYAPATYTNSAER